LIIKPGQAKILFTKTYLFMQRLQGAYTPIPPGIDFTVMTLHTMFFGQLFSRGRIGSQ
jgi:hypothetical protein